MKHLVRTLVTGLLLLLIHSISFAHYIWIEVAPEGAAGKAQTVKIFYGEYENGLREERGKRQEEVKGLTAWLISPSGKKDSLLLEAKENYFSSSFVPAQPGRYQIVAVNTVRPVVDWSAHDIGVVKPNYYASAFFLSLNSTTKPAASVNPVNELDIVPIFSQGAKSNYFTQNVTVDLRVYFKGSDAVKAKLMVYAPNGWMKELERNEKGFFSFTPLEKGQYVVECIYKEKTPGLYEGKNYEAIRQRATLTISVK